MELSDRLTSVCRMVTPGLKVADVGTDHGYVPVFLVTEGKIPSALAMDLREGPLEHARQTTLRYGCEDRIELRLSDGLSALSPGEAQCVVITGMGGDLIIRILERCPETCASLEELVLGPQSEWARVRTFLRGAGWHIEAEDMVCEDGKYYPVIKAVRGEETAVSRELLEDMYGPCLLSEGHPVLQDYLTWEEGLLLRNLEHLERSSTVSGQKRREEIEAQLEANRLAGRRCRDAQQAGADCV